MKLVKLNCKNCGAQIDIDLDRLQSFCPYCGQKLLIDIDQLGELLKEKEKTKQAHEETERARIRYKYLSQNSELIAALILGILCFVSAQ